MKCNWYQNIPNAFADWLGKTWAFWFAAAIALIGGISFGLSFIYKHGTVSIIIAVAIGAATLISQTIIQLLALFSLQAQQVKNAEEAKSHREELHAHAKKHVAELHETHSSQIKALHDHVKGRDVDLI